LLNRILQHEGKGQTSAENTIEEAVFWNHHPPDQNGAGAEAEPKQTEIEEDWRGGEEKKRKKKKKKKKR
jgi:hypothetical protein